MKHVNQSHNDSSDKINGAQFQAQLNISSGDVQRPSNGTELVHFKAGLVAAARHAIEDMEKRNMTVIILEHFDLSLALLRRKLGLAYNDLLYLPLKQNTKNYSYFTRESVVGQAILQQMPCSETLYQHWKAKLLEAVAQEDSKFLEEADIIRNANKAVAEACGKGEVIKVFDTVIDELWCDAMGHMKDHERCRKTDEAQKNWIQEFGIPVTSICYNQTQ